MQVHTDIKNLPVFSNAVITTGTFDGVHTGHRQILDQLKWEALMAGGESVVITFDPHPRSVIPGNKQDIKLLSTLAEKIGLLSQLGIDHLVIVPFTLAFAGLSAEEYITEFLVNHFHPRCIITGYDHHFGKERKGNYQLLEEFGPEYGFSVKEIPEHILQHIAISSTRIRTALLEGDIRTANEFLGYPYFFSGSVVEGNKLGRTLGYPTANLKISESNKLVPGNGVYAVTIKRESNQLKYGGMMNIGIRPTVDGTNRVTEVNIFDFDEDIYGRILNINILQRLRNEEKFSGLEALKKQLAIDKKNALAVLNSK